MRTLREPFASHYYWHIALTAGLLVLVSYYWLGSFWYLLLALSTLLLRHRWAFLLALTMAGAISVSAWQPAIQHPFCSVDWSSDTAFGYKTLFSNGRVNGLIYSQQPIPLAACLSETPQWRSPNSRQAQGVFDPVSYFASHNIIGDASIDLSEQSLIVRHTFASRLRQWLNQHIAHTDYPGFWRALLLGSRSGLSDGDKQLLQSAQVYHLFVVSGLHISLILVCVYYLIIPLSYRLAPIAMVLIALSLPSLLGQGVSVWRAAIMACFGAALLLMRRRQHRWLVLLSCAYVLSLLQPMQWGNIGAWLSFAAVAILAQMPSGAPLWQVQARLVCALLPLGWALGLALAPLNSAINLIAIPALVIILPLGYLLATFDLLMWLDPLMAGFLWLLERLPGAFYWPAPVMGYASLVIAACWVWLFRFPGRLVVSVGLVVLAIYARPLAPEQVIALDVGQGSAIIVFDPPNALIVDTGPGNPALTSSSGRAIATELASWRGIETLTLLISHDDLDHKGGTISLLRYWPTTKVIVGQAVNNLLATPCENYASTWRWLAATNDNDASCVLDWPFANGRVLITGDLSRQGEYAWLASQGALGQQHSRLLIAGHHGSATSTSQALLRRFSPTCVWFTAGQGNAFDHPSASVLAKVRRYGVDFRTTGEHGSLIWRPNSDDCRS